MKLSKKLNNLWPWFGFWTNFYMDFELFPGVPIEERKYNEEGKEIKQTVVIDHGKIIRDQKNDLVNHLKKVKQIADEIHALYMKVNDRMGSEISDAADGVSLLQVRNHCLCEYLENLVDFSGARCNGCDVSPSIDALVTNKLVLEKIKPIEKQLHYQLNKYAEMEKGKTTSLRANPSSMLHRDDEQNPDGLVNAEYQAPKVMSTLYPKADNDAVKEAKHARRIKAKGKEHALLDEVAADITEDPLDAGRKNVSNKSINEFLQREKEIEQFEEEHFVRLTRSKKDKSMMKKIEQLQGSLEGILNYEKIRSDADYNKSKKDRKSGKK